MKCTVSLEREKRGAWWCWCAFAHVAQPPSVKAMKVASSIGGFVPIQTSRRFYLRHEQGLSSPAQISYECLMYREELA